MENQALELVLYMTYTYQFCNVAYWHSEIESHVTQKFANIHLADQI